MPFPHPAYRKKGSCKSLTGNCSSLRRSC